MKREESSLYFFVGIIFSTLLLLFGSLQSISFAAGKDLVICAEGGTFGDAIKKCFVKPFEKETGIRVTYVSPWNFAKLKAMVDTGNVEWDIMENPPKTRFRARNEGLLEELDYSAIPLAENCIPEGKAPHWLGMIFYSINICYNTKTYSKENHPRSMAEFWDVKKFPGRRALQNNPVANLEFALLADGVPRDKLYPLDVDRAFKKLDEIKKHITVWWKVGAQPPQLITDGEVDLSTAFNGRAFAVYSKGGPLGLEWGDGIVKMTAWSIPKGSKNRENAHNFLNFFLKGDLWEPFLKMMPYPGPSKDIYKYIPAEFSKDMPLFPANLEKMFVIDDGWWDKNIQEVQERWNKWMLE